MGFEGFVSGLKPPSTVGLKPPSTDDDAFLDAAIAENKAAAEKELRAKRTTATTFCNALAMIRPVSYKIIS